MKNLKSQPHPGDSPYKGSCLQLLLLPLLSAIDWGASHRSEVASTESKTSTNFKWRQQWRSKMDKATATTAMCKWSCDHCNILTRFKLHRETPLALSTSVGLASSQSQLLLILFLVVWFCCWWLSCCCLYSLWWRFCSLLFCWTYFLCRFEITDGDGNVALKILGPWCTYSCAGDVEFKVFFSNSG